MRRLRFGRTGIEIPAVGLGTWGHGGPRTAGGSSVGWSGHDDALAREALLTAAREGIDHWDTADVYGDGQAERLIGSVWPEVSRQSIFLASKVGWDAGEFDHYYHPAQIRRQFEASLRNLKCETIDLYYLHHCDFGPNDEYLDDAIALLRQFRDEGRIRFIGLSDWDSERIMRVIGRVDPDAVQPYRNVVDDDYAASGLQQWVEEHDIGVAFFSPLKHGLLLGKYDTPQEFEEGDFRRNVAEFSDPAALERIGRAAAAMRERFSGMEEPVLHALVGALLADAPTGCVLLGQRNPDQVRSATRVGEPLDREMAEWVRQQYRG
jgi:aryl-alcohol dehydrogenase-like predicted oxidoreductase